jgi:hypothetical protein
MKKFLIAMLAVAASGASAAQQPEPSFCARLAPQIGLSPTNRPELWEGRLISGLKAAFVGGSASIGFGVESVGTPTPEDATALREACKMVKGQYRCVVDRPMILLVSSSKGDARVEAQPGEKALVVTSKGMRVRCTDGVTS